MPKVKREVKKAEAIRWMKVLGINPEVIKSFKEHETIMVCEGDTGAFSPITNKVLSDQIHEFEQQWDALVYMVVSMWTVYGQLDSLLFVDNYSDEWELDIADLKDGYVLSWTIDQDCPVCSDMGSIFVERTANGGLIRRG